VAIRGQYDDGQDRYGEVLFQREFVETAALSNIFEPLQVAFKAIEALSQYYQTSRINGLLGNMEIAVVKSGRGLVLTYGWLAGKGLAIEQYQARYCVALADGWRISFGSQASPTDYELTQWMINITAPWNA
jgi:hypothetical protein